MGVLNRSEGVDAIVVEGEKGRMGEGETEKG
jgi:hypothetical protein